MEIEWPGWSSDAFLDALRETYFPGTRKAVVECDGVRVRTLLAGKRRAITGFYPFPFALDPLPAEYSGPSVAVPSLKEVVVGISRVEERQAAVGQAAPFVSWKEFPTWEEFLAKVPAKPGIDSVRTVQAKVRRLERALGPIELTEWDHDEATFATILNWKIAQYARSGGGIFRLNVRQNREFYQALFRRGVFRCTTARAGGMLLGGRLSHHSGKRDLSRLIVFNPALREHSPGSVLQFESLRRSYESGDEEFDFLSGTETYKFTYATHIRWIGSVGSEPRIERWRRRGRMRAALVAHRAPLAYHALKRVEVSGAQALRRLRPK